MYSWYGVMPRGVLKLPVPEINTTVTPTDITRNPQVTSWRSLADCQSAVRVLRPEKTYQSSNKLMAAIIKNIFKKFTVPVKPAI